MPKHRYEFKRAWHQQRRHYTYRLLQHFRLWLRDQRAELQDIAAELKERTKRGH